MIRIAAKAVLSLTLAASVIGCETKAGTGALIGGAGGAAVGGLIGSGSHARAGEGALIGGAIGAIGGGLVGHGMDKDDEKKARDKREYEQSRQQTRYEARTMESRQTPITQENVIAWTARGTKDEIIIDRIQQSNTRFYLTAADENSLRDNGVSPEVIRAMKDTARR
jgi:uncharacterized protein YcfJ